jgi:hypothetical protein
MSEVDDLKILTLKDSFAQFILFCIFVNCIFYCTSILPCGRYYYDDEASYVGNT